MSTKVYKTLKLIIQLFYLGLLLLLVIFCLFSAWVGSLLMERANERKVNIATLEAAPVPNSVVQNLCHNPLISVPLSTCADNVLLPKDVIRIVKSNVIENVSTYDDVSDMFANYENYCEMPSPNRTEFRCTYIIRGVRPIYIFYDRETRLIKSIIAVSWDSGS